MPEYFDISLIQQRNICDGKTLKGCIFEKIGLREGENKIESFNKRKVLISVFQEDKIDFEELCMSFSDQTFNKSNFREELKKITSFVNICFKACPKIEFALCSYELNGYLLRNIETLEEFTEDLLKQFPIVYSREKESRVALLKLNLNAQELWGTQE